MKKILFVFMTTLTLVACKKNDDLPGQEPEQLLELRHGNEFVKLQYDAAGKVSKAIVKDEVITDGDEVQYTISYNAQGKIAEMLSSDGETVRAVYTNGRLTKAEYVAGNQVYGFTEYEYQNNLVKTIRMKGADNNNNTVTVMLFELTYNAQNQVVKSEVSIRNPFADVLEKAGYTLLDYDSKKNPLYDMGDLMLLLLEVPAANNVIKETQYEADDELEETREYTYTYNSKNLPTGAVLKSTFPGQPATTSNVTYTYR